MCAMKSVRLLVAASALLLSLVGGSASAWEFSLEGEFNWKNRFVSQLGTKGFFGKYDLDNSSTPGNFRVRQRLGRRKTRRSVVLKWRCRAANGGQRSPRIEDKSSDEAERRVPDWVLWRPHSLSLCQLNESRCAGRDF